MHKINEITINSWNEFDDIVKKRSYRKWIYRGQIDANWELESSLYRAFKTAQEIIKCSNNGKEKRFSRSKHEAVMINRFKANAHLYLNHLPKDDDDFSCLALMQHYGAPSRLLDFSFSPYIAAYFALENGIGDASIYGINHAELKKLDIDYFGQNTDLHEMYNNVLNKNKSSDEQFLFSFEPSFSNERIIAQQGMFLMPNSLTLSHQEILEEYEITNNHGKRLMSSVLDLF